MPSVDMTKNSSLSIFAIAQVMDEAQGRLEEQQASQDNITDDLVVSVVFIDSQPKRDSKC